MTSTSPATQPDRVLEQQRTQRSAFIRGLVLGVPSGVLLAAIIGPKYLGLILGTIAAILLALFGPPAT